MTISAIASAMRMRTNPHPSSPAPGPALSSCVSLPSPSLVEGAVCVESDVDLDVVDPGVAPAEEALVVSAELADSG